MDKSGIMEAKSPFVECSGFLLKDSVAPWRVPGCLEPTFSSRCSTAATAKGRMKKAKQSEERRKERKKERKKERRTHTCPLSLYFFPFRLLIDHATVESGGSGRSRKGLHKKKPNKTKKDRERKCDRLPFFLYQYSIAFGTPPESAVVVDGHSLFFYSSILYVWRLVTANRR